MSAIATNTRLETYSIEMLDKPIGSDQLFRNCDKEATQLKAWQDEYFD